MPRITPEQRCKSLLRPAFEEPFAESPFIRRSARRLTIAAGGAAFVVLAAHHLLSVMLDVPSTMSIAGALWPGLVGGRFAVLLVMVVLWQALLHHAFVLGLRGWREALLEDLRMANVSLGLVISPLGRAAVWGTCLGFGAGMLVFDRPLPALLTWIQFVAPSRRSAHPMWIALVVSLLVVPSAVLVMIYAVWSAMLATLQTDGLSQFVWRQGRYLSMAGLRVIFGVLMCAVWARVGRWVLGGLFGRAGLMMVWGLMVWFMPRMVWGFLRWSFEKAEKELDLVSQGVGEPE